MLKNNKKYRVCVVGIGAVGTEIVRLLKKRDFPMEDLTILARSSREEIIDGITYFVKEVSHDAFIGMDFAFFAGTEGAKGASQTYGWEATKHGCIVIDNGDDYRMDPDVPLVIPEINPAKLDDNPWFIANPNCSTIIALMAIYPLHESYTVKRIVATTFQAVSGTGTPAVRELTDQTRIWLSNGKITPQVYPHQIFGNIIPAVGSFKDDDGESTEEKKMRNEIRKILDDQSIKISSTCVRVPVMNGHSIALNLEFQNPVFPDWARHTLERAKGVKVIDDPKKDQYPMPINASGISEILVGRIRRDEGVPFGLSLWCSGDNLWKGAALNAIEIAEHIIAHNV